MQQRNLAWLILSLILVLGAVYVVIPGTGLPRIGSLPETRFTLQQGLDLQGGLQVLLEADVPPGTNINSSAMDTAKVIVEQRVNGLGVTEPLVQRQGSNRIVVELPGLKDPQAAIALLKETGLLEFVYVGSQFLSEGTEVQTDCADPSKVDCGKPAPLCPSAIVAETPTATPPPSPTATLVTDTATSTLPATDQATTATPAATATPSAATPQPPATPTTKPAGPTYCTLMTGVALKTANVGTRTGQVVVQFELTDAGKQIFADFTSQHVGEILAIVLDKKVISSPRINNAITEGQGEITGNFNIESANKLAVQLRYGALPVPLKVVQSREIGPTLGQDSLRKSALAGIIGVTAVILFMLLYYRLPGAIASLALLIYAVITIALFKLIGVTLTLPGIAGFVLSVGVAVDANILIFERMKEELRAGRNLRTAVEAGFKRAWPSIRDSNISTLITCAILYLFGNAYGASIVKGFAFTLALGVFVSLFTAILVTRAILHLFLDRIDFSERHSWFGI